MKFYRYFNKKTRPNIFGSILLDPIPQVFDQIDSATVSDDGYYLKAVDDTGYAITSSYSNVQNRTVQTRKSLEE